MRAVKFVVAISLSGLLGLGACSDDGGGSPDAQPATPDATPAPDADTTPDAMPTPAEALWLEITDYDTASADWAGFPGFPGIVAFTPHGATHRQVFANATARDDLAALADGSIIVKENRTGTDGADLAAITVMKLDAGEWTYAAYAPDGTNMAFGSGANAPANCVEATMCHGNDTDTGGDEVFLNNDAVAAKALFDELNDANANDGAYTTWNTFGGGAAAYAATAHPNVDFKREFINPTAEGDEAALADGSILVKEERSMGTQTDGSDSTLDALTVMQRVDATADTWFWAKVTTDGKVKFAGQDASAACANGNCHGGASAGADKVFANGMND